MTQKINNFPEEAIRELKSYVYRLIDPRNGETFYVGKGVGNRVFNHIKSKSLNTDDNQDKASEKLSRIRDINNSGLEVIHVIHRHGLDDATASEVEAALIDAYPGSTNIISGKNSDFSSMSCEEIIRRYAAEEAVLNHDVILIKINMSVTDKDIFDATRFAWRIDVSRAKRFKYVLAVDRGIIVGVFKPSEWLPATSENFIGLGDALGRYGFIGEYAEQEIESQYLKKRIPKKYQVKGASNPIMYHSES